MSISIDKMRLQIANLQVQADSPHNDGWTAQYYKSELATATAKLDEKLVEDDSDANEDDSDDERRGVIAGVNPEALFADGFDGAIIGYDASGACVVYDYQRCMNILMKRDKMDLHEAHEYMEFNVVSAYVGDFTPIFVHRFNDRPEFDSPV